MSVRPSARNNSAPSRRIFMKLEIWLFRKYVEKIQVSLKSDKNNFTWRLFHVYDNISLTSSYYEQ
jgi:hypothetical protein